MPLVKELKVTKPASIILSKAFMLLYRKSKELGKWSATIMITMCEIINVPPEKILLV